MAPSKRRGTARDPRPGPGSNGTAAGAAGDAGAPTPLQAVVVVACSAGGIPACRELFGALDGVRGLSFLVVVRPDGDESGDALAVVREATSLPARAASAGDSLTPDSVIVIDGAHAWELADSKLQRVDKPHRSTMPVDSLLLSMAGSVSEPLVAVVLNGASSDGTLGLEAVKAEGGITFAQTVDGTAFDSMPHNAIGSGVIDLVLPPAEIGRELAALATKLASGDGDPLQAEVERGRDDDLKRIFALLRMSRGVDFSHYRQTTIRRRIARRMLLQRVPTLGEYVRHLREHPQEVDALFHDMLIRVTSFFRDPQVFEALKATVLPQLAQGRAYDDPIRIWVPGCASGEEAYSLAIVLLESITDVRTATPMQLFATDISEAAIEKARAAVYPESIAADISPERLRRFFVKVDRGYQIDKSIRDMCVFARQNVTSDPPFSRIDLVSCRNLLIYLEPALQRRVMPIFHYALKRGGFLVLGNSETTGAMQELFASFDKKNKIFTKGHAASVPSLDFGATTVATRAPGAVPDRPVRARDLAIDLDRDVDRAIMSRYAPPGVVVDPEHQIVQFRGYTGSYLEPAPGEASLNIFKMAREGLLIELRTALHRAEVTQEPVRTGVLSIRTDDRYRDVVLQVLPLRSQLRDPAESVARHYLVLFETPTPVEAEQARPTDALHLAPDEASSMLERVELELASTREYLQSIIEEQEATNEELQSANEEILSSNEELQSINEELETAKEELQSTNEELTTVNEELHNRSSDLLAANNDLSSSLASVNLPIVLLTSDLRIRRFTPMAERVLHLIPTDIGRPVGDIKPKVDIDDLEQTVREVLTSMHERNRLVQDSSGRRYAMRIRPYRTSDNRIDGAVIYLVDVDEVAQLLQTDPPAVAP